MKKLTSLFAAAVLSVAATQASAANVFTISGDSTAAATLCGIIGCSSGAVANDLVINITLDAGLTSYHGVGTAGTGLVSLQILTDNGLGGGLTQFINIAAGGIPAFVDPFHYFDFDSDAGGNVVWGMAWAGGAQPIGYLAADGSSAFGVGGLACDPVTGAGCPFSDNPLMSQGTISSDDGHFATYAFTAPAAVPVPAAAWLFGSAMLGLVGVGRKRRA